MSGSQQPNDIYESHFEIAKGWYDAHYRGDEIYCTFDFYHSCCDTTYPGPISPNYCRVGIPYNYSFSGYQYPRTGDGFIGGAIYIKNYIIPINSGEFAQSKLVKTLEKDSIYKFQFYVSRSAKFGLATETIGAYFSPTKIRLMDFIWQIQDSTIVAQVTNKNGAIFDTLNWTKVEGIFKANGDEQYITLGNWDVRKGSYSVADASAIYNDAAYYNFDDLALYKVSTKANKADCGNDTLICKGESFVLGKTKIEDEYRDEYKFEWYVLGKEDSIFSLKQNPIVNPDTTTIFVLKLTDFKFDVSYDTIMVNVVECKIPTNFKVYPVPTSDIVNFEFNYPISRDMQIDLFDVNGRLINKYYAAQDFESKIVTIDLRTLASGVYIYQISFENKKTFYGKLVFVK
jgi:hypothetical protein